LSDRASQKIYDATWEERIGINILVNNAGIGFAASLGKSQKGDIAMIRLNIEAPCG
jgi:short-subunit dehydrogenase